MERPGGAVEAPVTEVHPQSLLPAAPASSEPLPANGPGDDASPWRKLVLTDFLDLRSLQEVQDSFAALTRLTTTIRDAQGRQITARSEPTAPSDAVLTSWPPAISPASFETDGLAAPIVVEGHTLGSISLERQGPGGKSQAGRERFRAAALSMGVAEKDADALIAAAEEAYGPNRAGSVQLVYLMANSLARLCYQEYQLRRRVEQLSTLYELSKVLSGHRDLKQVLDTAARSAAEALGVRGAFIRMLDDQGRELLPGAVYNLSQAYLDKGPILVEHSELFKQALAGQVVYIADMATDARIIYPEDARREGLVSFLCAAMVFRDEPIGVLQLYASQHREFSDDEISLLKAVAQILAAAIQHARLDAQRLEAERVQRQLLMAADVQKRMLPQQLPRLERYDLAARYVPSFELSGDFYDFIDLQGNLGIAVADVAGKGVAASLLMASVRSSLRAFAQDVYDIDQIMVRVNTALSRDTLSNEFATLFYGVLDPRQGRLTFCNAGHEPPLLLRRGQFQLLEAGGMIVGIDANQRYDKGIVDLEAGDLLLIYTDGLSDALNFDQHRFGRQRIMKAMLDAADQSAGEALNHILWEMRRYVGLNRGNDDTTLVVVKVKS